MTDRSSLAFAPGSGGTHPPSDRLPEGESAESGGERAARAEERASVEGLRGLGLSITQAARLVTNREARGGFASLDELDAVPGLPAEQRAELRERAHVDASTA